ncbi:leucine-rich repeat receptor-like serine/threonine-protein kinase [Pyrus ussuriensis x Pyrus communis]|uniref:Leucine-rich repeat receptor-like serine/threonine-protein kinase n=1 Tax=Pyrus ussuriensis x Pyrus communis TaxID=2448454 RepID=A0A5N5FGU5_9ROSA|nr:leucine-rich repeat receptor-like serine/threonine-protein kinase [Pyrus ussuriensis x Pyrus communis]
MVLIWRTSFSTKWELKCSYTICGSIDGGITFSAPDRLQRLGQRWRVRAASPLERLRFLHLRGNFALLRSWNVSDLFIFSFEGGVFSFISHTTFATPASDVIPSMAPINLARASATTLTSSTAHGNVTRISEPLATNPPNPEPSPSSLSSSSMLSILPLSLSEIFILLYGQLVSL